jgi:tetratricopeptide (TPR) repeat protein
VNPSPSIGADQEASGLKHYEAGDLEAAIVHFTRARQAYDAAGDALKSLEVRNSLSVTLVRAGRPHKALEAVEGTPQAFDELGDKSNAAKAFGNLASAQEACGDHAAAEASYRLAAERFAELGDRENHNFTMKALSQLQLRRGQPLMAALSLQSALEDKPNPGLRERWILKLLKVPFRLLRG